LLVPAFSSARLENMESHDTHILVVDDDPDLRELLGNYLSEQGFQVSGVENAAEMDRFLADRSPEETPSSPAPVG